MTKDCQQELAGTLSVYSLYEELVSCIDYLSYNSVILIFFLHILNRNRLISSNFSSSNYIHVGATA